MCLASGIYRAGEVVHHITELTPDNISNPDISLNFNNLKLLCRDHHGQAHRQGRRYFVNSDGKIISI